MHTGLPIVAVVLKSLILELSSLTETWLACIFVTFDALMTSNALAKKNWILIS